MTPRKRYLTIAQGVAVVIGIVVGVGIFRAPSSVANGADSTAGLISLWIFGGVISLVGGLCYAELAAAYPHPGGEYHFLERAFGKDVAFLFAWGRLAVVQTGAIAAVAFVFGDYMQRIAPLGAHGESLYAGASVILFSLVNRLGASPTRSIQSALAVLTLLALAAVALSCFLAAPVPNNAAADVAPGPGTPGLAMVFVLLAYGGWNEGAYLSADVRDPRRSMTRILLIGLSAVAIAYVILNLAYLRVLGLEGLRASNAVAADAMQRALGTTGALVISVVIAVASLSTLNATIYTGARSSYAAGLDFERLRSLGAWDDTNACPKNAILLQASVALALILLGTLTRNGFETMVELTAPVFWGFLLLIGLSLLFLRRRDPHTFPLRLPIVLPLLFCASSAYMLHASLAYTGIGAAVGVLLLVLGVPVLIWAKQPIRRSRI